MDLSVSENSDLLHGQVSFDMRARELEEERQKETQELKKSRSSPFNNFYQVNKNYSQFLSSCLKENPTALRILFFLFDNMDHYNAVVCSYVVFAEVLKISTRSVARSLKYLKDHGFIYIYKSGTSNVYVINNNLVWNSWGSNLKYCKFPANIVLSSSEQENTDVGIKPVKQKTIKTEIKDIKKNENKNAHQTN